MSIAMTKQFFYRMENLNKESVLSTLDNGTFGEAHIGGYPYILIEREGKICPIIYSRHHMHAATKKVRPAFDLERQQQLTYIVPRKGRESLEKDAQLAGLVTDITQFTQNIGLYWLPGTIDMVMFTEWGGIGLNKLISSGASLTWSARMHIAREVALGLYYLLAQGYLYTDLTLGHVLVKESIKSPFAIKIGDHGSIRAIGSMISDPCQLGTWGHHPPEHDAVFHGCFCQWQPPAIVFTFSVFFLMLRKSTIYQLINSVQHDYNKENRLSFLESYSWRTTFLVALETQIRQEITGRQDGQKLERLLGGGLFPNPGARSTLEQICYELQRIVA